MPHTFNVVKGKQHDADYFLTTMDYGEIDQMVVLPEGSEGSRLLDGTSDMQRQISWSRVRNDLVPYITESPDAFYSALTLIMVPRNMQPLQEGVGYNFVANPEGSDVGKLELTSNVLLFPGDGQHRAASIKEALKIDWELASVQVPVVLVPFKSRDQVRQLFSDLNLNAKPVGRTIGLAFDTRDPVAVLTKQLANMVPLFDDRINEKTNSLSNTSTEVVTMNSLHASNTALLISIYGDEKTFNMAMKELRATRGDGGDQKLNELAEELADIWSLVVDSLPEWKKVLKGELTPGEVRMKYVFAHGIGLQAIAQAAAIMMEEDPNGWKDTLALVLSDIDWLRTNPDWQGVSMVGTRMNNTGPGIRATAGYILEKAGVRGPAARPYLNSLALSRGSVPAEAVEA